MRARSLLLFGLVLGCQDAEKAPESASPDHSDSAAHSGDSPGDDSGGTDSQDSGPPDSGETGETGEPEPDGLPSLLQLSETPRNLLVLSVDTLRRDAVGAYTGGDDTPTLDGLMSAGVTFNAHRSCSSWTWPGSICAMTGARAEELGLVASVPDYAEDLEPLPEGVETLAGLLLDEGYQTGLVTANGYLGSATGLGAGFEIEWATSGRAGEAVTAAAVAMADDELDTTLPWMLHVHYVDPHSPYSPPEAYLSELEGLEEIPWDLDSDEGTVAATNAWHSLDDAGKANLLAHLQIRYAGEVRYVDDQIALLLGELESRGMLEDTLVVFWTDHGEQLFEHNARGHASSLYAQENDGVAFLWSPHLEPASWDGLTTNEDIPPTALAMLGLRPTEQMSGLVMGAREPDEPIFSTLVPQSKPPVQAVTVGDAKLLYGWNGRKEFFRRDSDPDETTDLYDETDPEVQKLWELLLPEVTELDALVERWSPESVGP